MVTPDVDLELRVAADPLFHSLLNTYGRLEGSLVSGPVFIVPCIFLNFVGIN